MDNIVKAAILKRLQVILGIEAGVWGSRTDMFLGNIIEILHLHKRPITINNIVKFYRKPSDIGKFTIPEYNKIVSEKYNSSSSIIDLIDENVSDSEKDTII